MSEILSNIVVEQNNINFSPDNNNINITPEAIQLNIYTGGAGGTGTSNIGQLLYNNNAIIGGVANTLYANGNLLLGDISNIQITGGTNGYVLQTDGTGNLTWTAQTGGGGGNGTPGGANTQIQYNDSGSFGGNAGFTFNEVSGNVAIPGNLSVVGTIFGNANYAITAGTVITSNQPNITSVGTLTSLTVNGITALGNVSNVQISGGSNNQVLTTNGSNTLSWSTRSDGSWATPGTIPIGGICFGKVYGLTTSTIGPGNIFTSNSNFNFGNFQSVLPGVTGNASEFSSVGSRTYTASYTSNVVAFTTNGSTWTNLSTPLKPHIAPLKGQNNLVIFATNSNLSAYSTNLGNTWSNVTLPNSGGWQDIAYGGNTFVMCTTALGYNKIAYSTNEGLSWLDSTVDVGFPTTNPNYKNCVFGNGVFMITSLSGPYRAYTSPPVSVGTPWTAISSPGPIDDLAYGNGIWVGIQGNSAGTAKSTFSTDNGVTWTNGSISNIGWNQITYADPYFVATAGISNSIAYSTDGNTWSFANTTINGGYIGYNNNTKLLLVSNYLGNNTISINAPTALFIDDDIGTSGNLQSVTNGTYKNLGGGLGNVGAMWQRIT